MSDEPKVRFRVTVTGEYEATPGCDDYDGETDPRRMAAIDASNDWFALLEIVAEDGGLTMTVEPAPSSDPNGDTLRAFVESVARLNESAWIGERCHTSLTGLIVRAQTALAASPPSVREGGDGPREVFVVLTHGNCFINAYLTHEAAEREARDGGGRYLVDRVELPDAEEAPDVTV